jgi:dTDP-4-dehydrorhamnose reductase
VDWCEDHKAETVSANVIGVLNLSDLCEERGIHCTVFATGCIFEYDEEVRQEKGGGREGGGGMGGQGEKKRGGTRRRDTTKQQTSKMPTPPFPPLPHHPQHKLGSGVGFTEDDTANFEASWYSKTKGMVEQMLQVYSSTLILRVRMPISDDLSPRNFITKIVKYDRVVNVPNSMTVLHELLPASLVMAEKKLSGVYNFCNPGVISHNEMLDLYKKYIDDTYTYTNFSLEDQDKILKAGRSNNELNCTKLVEAVPECKINEIHKACELVFQRMKINLTEDGTIPGKLFKRKPA